ncbi:MAG TPA: S8 family serine peptidase [Mycobacteriales bacterium]|nr:S8 family serine peptidase [Mycobacteriales bacterium]
MSRAVHWALAASVAAALTGELPAAAEPPRRLAAAAAPLAAAPGTVGPAAASPDSHLTARVLARFRPGAGRAVEFALRSAGARPAGPADRYGVHLLLSEDPVRAVAELRKHDAVIWAEREVRYERYAETTSTQERTEVGFDEAIAASAGSMRGAGIAVAVIDDGVDPSNPDLSTPGKVVDGGDFTGEPAATGLTATESHGTAVAAIIAATQGNGVGIVGGAPDATIISYRVFDAAGGSGSAGVRAAILRAVDDGVSVINLSLGGPFRSRAVSEAIEQALAADVVTVVATGNDGTERPNFPAGDRGVLSVGATQLVGGVWTVAAFSNGGAVDVVAPGANITSWWRDSAGVPQVQQLDGTSFAAPQVAAIAAGLASSGVRGDRARAAIAASAEAVPNGASYRAGAGRADAATAYSLATGGTPFSAVFMAGGHTVATVVGRRTVDALRWDPAIGTADDGPPTVTATSGTLGLPAQSSRDIGTGRLHRVTTTYDAPKSDPGSPSTAEVVAAGPGDVAERLPIRLVRPTNGPEGLPMASGTTQTTTLVRGTSSSYIRSITLPASPSLDVSFRTPPASALTALYVWAPMIAGGSASAYDVPVDSIEGPLGNGTLSFPSPGAARVSYPAGRYAVGFLLDPYDERRTAGTATGADDGEYFLKLDTPTGVTITGATVQLVSDRRTTSSFVVQWAARTPGVTFDVEWTQRYRNAAGQWYIGEWRPWFGFTGTSRTTGTFGEEGGTVAEPTKTYFLRVRGRDSVGNVSSWSAFRQYVVPVDDRYPFVRYTGAWSSSTADSAYLGTLHSTTAVAGLTLAADTAGFTVVGERCPTCGLLRIRVDGGSWRTVDSYASTTLARQQLLYTGSFGAIGRHTLEVQTLATRGRPRVALDAIAVIR